MKTVSVRLEVIIPDEVDNATHLQIVEWIRFNVGYTACCSNTNPLVDYCLETDYVHVDKDVVEI